ncbi:MULTISPECIES: hypothetical protein [unclassified Pseudomonas]|uniref:hypothetical protein n=1 Tax=unclassified Pseudomonas TaxID=196821 RepID=UPI0021C6A42C|nr:MULTISPECIES: hypothetical protein [unclassified Pseudomonas]MCU1733140.1 hypothetical protein [Pseudomonas sp. 20P_3.2_Bac4]MCU1744241.1 hypothetical protein [Pseudomonas sp. 20P_3.2_Bac5]
MRQKWWELCACSVAYLFDRLMSELPSLPDSWKTELSRLEAVLLWTENFPEDYDFPMPVMVSHAAEYANDEQKLRNYAQQVIAARLMHFTFVTSYKVNHFLRMYLDGFSSKNFYSMLFAARSMVEIFAVVFDLFDHMKQNRGDHPDRYFDRVISIDKALINATSGNRLDFVKDVIASATPSKLREFSEDDMLTIQAKNIMTRIDRSSKKSSYTECRSDYDRLSEYIHPNIGQNSVLCWPSPKNEKWVRISRSSEYSVASAFRASILPTQKAAEAIMREVTSMEFPFGTPVVA